MKLYAKGKPVISAMIVMLIAIPPPFALAGDVVSAYTGHDFTAQLTQFHLQHPQQARTSRIFLSANGMRLQNSEMFGPNKSGWLIQNRQHKLSWVVQPARRIYALLPDDTEADQQSDDSSSGFMATKACSQASLLSKELIGSERVSGFATQVWECRFSSFSVKQFFSTDLAMVIREEQPSQQIMELQRIEKSHYDDDFFKPSVSWSEVTLEEFIMGAKPLERFYE